MVNEELFKRIMIRERKREDRSNQPFALLLVTINARPGVNASVTWARAIDAVTAGTRETDVVGWFEHGAVIGVIMPRVGPSRATPADVKDRIRRKLAKRLDEDTVGRFSFRLYVQSESNRVVREGLRPVESVLLTLGSRRQRATTHDRLKRGLDLVGSLGLLLVLSPFFLLIAALVRLGSRGPVFFRQVRVGQMMKPFTMLKFRTMHEDAEDAIHHQFVTQFIQAKSQVEEPGKSGLFKITNDPRVTAVGRWLRKTSLDELPQLWNVLRGDMSLVGPRPPLPYEVEQYQPWHCRRILEAKPGMTGLWQVAGRSQTTFDEMVRLDLRYARTRSLWIDLKILLATPMAVFAGKGAC